MGSSGCLDLAIIDADDSPFGLVSLIRSTQSASCVVGAPSAGRGFATRALTDLWAWQTPTSGSPGWSSRLSPDSAPQSLWRNAAASSPLVLSSGSRTRGGSTNSPYGSDARNGLGRCAPERGGLARWPHRGWRVRVGLARPRNARGTRGSECDGFDNTFVSADRRTCGQAALLSAWVVRGWLGKPANIAPEEHEGMRRFSPDELPPPHVLGCTALVDAIRSHRKRGHRHDGGR